MTNLSGRGVGMDVVKTNLGRIGGSVEVATTPGKGTIYTLKIPLTLAIIPALLVTSGAQRYAIPQVNLIELVRATPEQIEQVHGAPVLRLRGRLLPLVYLARELGGEIAETRSHHVVVLQADDRRFGLVVDGVTDSAEIVVKPVGTYLKAVDTFAGATILGDGSVGLILDVIGLARRAHVLTTDQERELATLYDDQDETEVDGVSLLVFSDHEGGRMAIPLELVTRLEEFPRDELESSGPFPVVQYGEEILHLVDISRLMLDRRRASRTDGLSERRRDAAGDRLSARGPSRRRRRRADPRRRATRPGRAAARLAPRCGRHDGHAGPRHRGARSAARSCRTGTRTRWPRSPASRS